MKKYLVALVVLLLPAFCSFSQKTLSIKDVTPPLSVYPCGDRHEALVVFRCSENFTLEFQSNVDKTIPVDTMSEGSEKVYNIVFPTIAEGTSYKGRQLIIMAPGFNKIYLPLDLKDKEKYEYLISDPYSPLRSLYYTSTEEGCALMQKGAFLEAKDKFTIAKCCPEYDEASSNINSYMKACDSCLVYMDRIKSFEKTGNISQARLSCAMILSFVPNCDYATFEMNRLNQKFAEECNYDRQVANEYIENGKLKEARERLQHSIDIGSPYAAEAQIKIQDINKKLYKSDNYTRSFSYQYCPERPFGFFTSSLRPKGMGGYFSLAFNKGIIDLFAQKLQPVEDATKFDYEAGASIGFSIPVVPKYGWILVSPFGYIGGGSLIGNSENYWTNVQWYSGIAPEVGVACKVWRITLSYRLQYKYFFSKDEFIDKMNGTLGHMFALGICW